jgi:putative DNA primase/helicase
MALDIVNFEEAKAKLAEPAPAPDKHKPDDDELAQWLVPALRGKLAFFHSEWKMYDAGCWRPRNAAEMRRYIRQELRQFRRQGVAVNQGRIKALSSMLEDELFIPDKVISAQSEARKEYINLRNGLFNLSTFRLEEHRPELFFTTQLAFDFDPDASAPTFHRYLNTSLVLSNGKTDHALVWLVKEALAYSMTARTDLKASFWLVGEKDSGKSTFVSVIKGLMGELHATIDLTQLATNRFILASAVGKRVITFTEASESSMLPDAIYKTLTGGSDDIQVDVKNRDPITFRPEAKIWWAMNGMPRMQDRSGATARRITIIPFNRSIPADQRISDLENRLLRERSGIFNELITAMKRMINGGGFDYCEQSDQRLQQYVMENDTEQVFIAECCELHESYRVRSSELYSEYAEWCKAGNFKPKNANQIAKEWRRLGFERRTSDGAWWHGVRISQKKS